VEKLQFDPIKEKWKGTDLSAIRERVPQPRLKEKRNTLLDLIVSSSRPNNEDIPPLK
jgi:hypothetical protein